MLKGQKERPKEFPTFVTCPTEMVAMSMADGFSRLTGRAQAVVVHVDVGTQALGPAMHNASCGRAPVLVFAGLSPYTLEGEMLGSRNEFQHWLQDIPNQRQIISQYCRYTAEIKSGKNIKQMVNRALQFANSNPQGPTYLCAAREVMEEELQPYSPFPMHPVHSAALPESGVDKISTDLVKALEPLIIVGRTGRSAVATEALIALADLNGRMRVLDAGGSDMCFPISHPAALGTKYGAHKAIETSDVILVIDCDVPWIPTRCKPSDAAKIYHIDVDPLKQNMSLFYINSTATYEAESTTALKQLVNFISSSERLGDILSSPDSVTARTSRCTAHQEWRTSIESFAAYSRKDDASISAQYLASRLRKYCPPDTIWVVEAVTLTETIAEGISATLPHTWINCGASGLGWSGGAALGVKLASKHLGQHDKFICQIVGDGGYMFSIPSSVYWISGRYKLPILTIVLNNRGWVAPGRSLLMYHPDGEGSNASMEDLATSFSPSPDYSGIAQCAAGGNLWANRASTVQELLNLLPAAIESVIQGTGAVLEAELDGSTT
ncbi:hypothetical protein N7466_007965 [Penicillium verhagenii]|uniref:uncharacterized protein n=1 Tax=Penicillium verhagenii TaxID=1562060 RepID=UPI0025452235|nr:uncharacterized protein N7466_007965 [Penicillium verhagenii]KAJ5929009.1 hypothetical protein N7466_007965 [Penicillium verhagenii]